MIKEKLEEYVQKNLSKIPGYVNVPSHSHAFLAGVCVGIQGTSQAVQENLDSRNAQIRAIHLLLDELEVELQKLS
jgi:hypothetical protein